VVEGGGEVQTADAPSGAHDVFVSYASPDTEVANDISVALERQGLKCWIAPRDVTPGAHYASEIVHAIDSAKAIVLVFSRDAATSPHVLREVERATSHRHPVITLRVDLAPLPAEFEYFLNTSQWLDASGTEIVRSMPKLIAAVRVAIHSPMTGKADATPRVPAQSPLARASKRTAIVVASVIGLAMAGFAIDRLWISSRRDAPTSPPTAGVSAGPTISEKSVAVLPFVDMSEKKDQEYFSDGLSEELIDMLTKVKDLRVPARTSSFYFKGKQTTIADIAKALGVSHVLEGSVRKSGNTLRVTAQLIRVDNGYHIWSETYDRPFDDVFKIQDDIAGAVVNALKVSLLSTASNRSAPTASTEAYTAYLQGRSIFLRGSTSADMEKAADYLHRALTLDPAFAPSWAELSFVRLWQVWYFPLEGAAEEARAAAERAVVVDPALPEAHVALGRVRETLDWDWAAADKELQLALELSPMNARILRSAADIPLIRGEYDKAVPLYLRSKTQDPLDDITLSELAWMYYFMGRHADAEATYRQALDLNPASAGSVAGAHWELAMVLVARGELLDALSEMQRERSGLANQGFAIIYHAMGRRIESDAAMVAAEREQSQHATPKYWSSGAVWIACAHAYRGEVDQALAWLDRAYERRDFGLVYLKGSPLLRILENDSRYKAFLRKMNLPE
jgi:TolB-like protein/tetratricopeptide (TPR) repeat protein